MKRKKMSLWKIFENKRKAKMLLPCDALCRIVTKEKHRLHKKKRLFVSVSRISIRRKEKGSRWRRKTQLALERRFLLHLNIKTPWAEKTVRQRVESTKSIFAVSKEEKINENFTVEGDHWLFRNDQFVWHFSINRSPPRESWHCPG